MKSIGIIPARGGSKGIPNKNIYPVNGKPLIEYTFEAAQSSQLDEIIVSTDSSDIANIAKKNGIKVIFRPPELAEDETPTLPVIQHALQEIGIEFDLIMTLQPTSPLRTSKHINDALKKFQCSPDADSLVSVVKVPHNMIPESIMTLKDGGLSSYINSNETYRRQDKPTYFARNGAAIYITKWSCIKKFIFGGNLIPFEMDFFSSVDIDTIDDLKLAEQILSLKETNV